MFWVTILLVIIGGPRTSFGGFLGHIAGPSAGSSAGPSARPSAGLSAGPGLTAREGSRRGFGLVQAQPSLALGGGLDQIEQLLIRIPNHFIFMVDRSHSWLLYSNG